MTSRARTASRAAAVALPLILCALAARQAAAVTGFGADAAISFAQAARCLAEAEFPVHGLLNSHEFWNPNGLILAILPLVALARDPLVFCVLLSIAQAGIVLTCFRWLATGGSGHFDWLFYSFWLPALIGTPVLVHTSVDLWAQYVGRTFLCLLCALALSTGWHESPVRDAALGFMVVFAPAVHLGLLPAAPIALLWVLDASRRSRVRAWPVAAGAASAVIASWLPWIVGGGPASAASTRLAGGLASHNEWAAAVLGPVADLPWLLSDPYEGWLPAARAGLLSMETDRTLQTVADIRCDLALAVLLASAMLLLARRRTGAIALETLGYVLLLLYVWEAKGADLAQRPDFGGMALQPLYLGIAAGGYRLLVAFDEWLRRTRRRTSSVLRLAVAAGLTVQLFLGWAGLEGIAGDVRRNAAFTFADIPLEEKITAMRALESAAGGRPRLTVAYHNPDFHLVFPYVYPYGRHESPPGRNYRAASFFEAVLNRRSATTYRFVEAAEEAEYVITFPARSPWAAERGYVPSWRGRRLGVWRRPAI